MLLMQIGTMIHKVHDGMKLTIGDDMCHRCKLLSRVMHVNVHLDLLHEIMVDRHLAGAASSMEGVGHCHRDAMPCTSSSFANSSVKCTYTKLLGVQRKHCLPT